MDDDLAAAIAAVFARFPAAQLVLFGPCDYPECNRDGNQHRNGVWCDQHAVKMERTQSL